MFGKLLKYEWRAAGHALLPFYLVVLAVSAVNSLMIHLGSGGPSEELMDSALGELIQGIRVRAGDISDLHIHLRIDRLTDTVGDILQQLMGIFHLGKDHRNIQILYRYVQGVKRLLISVGRGKLFSEGSIKHHPGIGIVILHGGGCGIRPHLTSSAGAVIADIKNR